MGGKMEEEAPLANACNVARWGSPRLVSETSTRIHLSC